MSLDIGTCVVQYIKNGGHRLGVIYKKRMGSGGWAFFEVLWVSGERSTERCDKIKTCKSIESQFTDLMMLKDLEASISAGGSYD